jgi:hypothetical protein
VKLLARLLPAGEDCCLYPCPSGRLSADIRARRQNCHPYSKPMSSRDDMGAESWVVIGGAYTEFEGFLVVHHKTTGFLGWFTKPRLKNRRQRFNNIGPVWPVGTGLTSEEYWSNWCAMTQSRFLEAEAMRSRCVSSTSKIPDCIFAHRLDRCSSTVRLVKPTGQTSAPRRPD